MSLPICLCSNCGHWSDECSCDLRDRRWDLSKPKQSKVMKDLLNKIHLGDSLELMKQLPDNCIDLIVTDPPYIVDTTAPKENYLGASKKHSKINNAYWNEKGFEAKPRMSLEAIKDGFDYELYFNVWERVCKKFNAFIFCSNKQLSEIIIQGEKRGFTTSVLVWHKTNTTPFANGVWRSDLEYIVHIRESGATFQGTAKEKSKIYISPTEISKYNHPTEKPIELIKKYIKIGSDENDIILDPFIGSGTTANACIQLDRQFIGYEIEPKYHAIANDRIKRAYGNVGLFEEL